MIFLLNENDLGDSYSSVPDKNCVLISKILISLPSPMFDHLLELSLQDNSNKWST